MNLMNRRNAISALVASVATLKAKSSVGAQWTEQEVRNGLQVTSTGDVRVEQAASGNQEVGVLIDGRVVTDDGIYRTGTSQVVVNDGQITSTGDVDVVQSASGQQEVSVVRLSGITPGDVVSGECRPGDVVADPDTGQLFYVARDCCLYPACASDCQKTCQTCAGHGKYK